MFCTQDSVLQKTDMNLSRIRSQCPVGSNCPDLANIPHTRMYSEELKPLQSIVCQGGGDDKALFLL